MKPIILVSAAILVNTDEQILLTERPEGKHLAGTWEFPGGKIENGETAETALIREMYEELKITIKVKDLKPFTFISHEYDEISLLMMLFSCKKWSGKISPQEQQQFCWVSLSDLTNYAMPPADIPLIPILQEGLKL